MAQIRYYANGWKGWLFGGDAARRLSVRIRGWKPKRCWEIIQQSTVPVVVDAGIGVPSHAAQALEMGADAVLVNTAIAVADDPVMMATAFRLAVEAEYWRVRRCRVIVAPTPAPPARSPDFGGPGMKTFSDRWRQLSGTIFACASMVKPPPTWSAR